MVLNARPAAENAEALVVENARPSEEKYEAEVVEKEDSVPLVR